MNHDCSTKAVFLCTAVKLQSCHMLAYWTQHTGPSNTFQSAFIWAIALVVLWSVHKGVPKQTCKDYLRRKQWCKLMDQIQTAVWQFFCNSFGTSFCYWNEAPWHWSKHLKFGPSWVMAVPQRMLGWPWANLGLCLRNHIKTLISSVYLCIISQEGFPRQTCINQVGLEHGCKLV